MTGGAASTVDEVAPGEAFEGLASASSAAMVDVRTKAEWAFTGLPDIRATGKALWPVEWIGFPTMVPNPAFVDQLMEHAGQRLPDRLYFICRSGARSMAAACRVAEAADRPVHCTNVAEGFEGDLDQHGHRGSLNGWKARGLPWRQT